DADKGAIDAPGHRVERLGSRLVLTDRKTPGHRANPKNFVNLFQYSLSIPGEVELAEAGCVVAAELGPGPGDARAPARSGKGPLAIVRRDLFRGPLAVRNRRPGDKFRPVGLRGRKKLQDYFVDRKVARDQRDQVPIVVDENDRIIWVAGHGIDERFQVREPTQAVVILRLKLWGESE